MDNGINSEDEMRRCELACVLGSSPDDDDHVYENRR